MKGVYWWCFAFVIFFLNLFGFIGCSEMGLIESLTVLFFLLAAFYQYKSIDKSWFHILFLVIFVFGALEEISYGQHFFGYDVDTSEFNTHNETNLHNVLIVSSFEIEGFVKIGVLLFGLSLVASFIPLFRHFYQKINYPGGQPFVGLLLVGVILFEMIFSSFIFLDGSCLLEEPFEFLISFLFFRYSQRGNW